MSILGFFEKWSDAKSSSNVKNDQIQKMTEKLRDNIKQDFQQSPDKQNALDAFRTLLEGTIKKHVESQPPISSKKGPAELPPVDAVSMFYVSDSHMEAYACLLPPLNGGKDVEKNSFLEDMRYQGIVFGIKDEEISRFLSTPDYLHIVQIACGIWPQDGKDGEREDLYEARAERNLELGEDEPLQDINFRKHDQVQTIRKGETICRIKPPVEAHDGKDVFGRVISGKTGTPVPIPQGDNTLLSEDGLLLLASMDGIVVTREGNFAVRSQDMVFSNVDAQTGDLTFQGDVFIHGDIMDGVTVHAFGNIIIDGNIRNGKVISGGTIRVQGEVKGSSESRLTATRQIQCTIIEQASAVAKENIYAEVIANSSVISENGSICALMGRGLIFGGETRAFKSIRAKKIGNISGCPNDIALTYLSELSQLRADKKKELENIQKTLEKLRKNISSLQIAGINLQRDKKEGYAKLTEQRSLYEELERTKTKELKELEKNYQSYKSGSISCEEIYPVTQIHIGEQALVIQKADTNCNIHIAGNQIVIK